jgi:hypothetical protein
MRCERPTDPREQDGPMPLRAKLTACERAPVRLGPGARHALGASSSILGRA